MNLGNIEKSVRRSVYVFIRGSLFYSVLNSVRVPAGLSAWDYSTWSSIQDSVRSRYGSR
jgi:hypothetical protein